TIAIDIVLAPAGVDLHIAAIGPAQLLQDFLECSEAGVTFRIVRRVHEHANTPHALLRQRPHRPRSRRATEEREEGAAADHSMTSSARSRTDAGMVRPRALAVLRLSTNSNLAGVSIGVSAGLAPSRIL